MNAITLENTAEKYLISVDKKALKEETVLLLIERLRMEYLAQKIDFAEDEDIEALDEEIKTNWWQQNKSRLLGLE